jgi:hypothetical protein
MIRDKPPAAFGGGPRRQRQDWYTYGPLDGESDFQEHIVCEPPTSGRFMLEDGPNQCVDLMWIGREQDIPSTLVRYCPIMRALRGLATIERGKPDFKGYAPMCRARYPDGTSKFFICTLPAPTGCYAVVDGAVCWQDLREPLLAPEQQRPLMKRVRLNKPPIKRVRLTARAKSSVT